MRAKELLRRMALPVALALGTPGTAVAAPPAYYPSGPQANVARSALAGWQQCWRGTYDQSGTSIAATLAACPGDYLLLASGPVGASTFDVLAAAPRADVVTNTGTGNTPRIANGAAWYFSSNASWGFAKAGDAISRNLCDIAGSSFDNFARPNGHLRLCWHTSNSSIVVGWRSGANVALNNNANFERFIFVPGAANAAPAVDELAGPAAVVEGGTETYSVAASDPDSDPLTYEWAVTAGSGEIIGAADGPSVDVHFPDGPDETTLAVEVSDGRGAAVTRTSNVAVENAAPSIGTPVLGGADATACLGGNPIALAFAFSDPAGVFDTHSGSVAWGDGGADTFTASPVSLAHTYAAGNYTLRIAVTDSDGAAAPEQTAPVSLLYDPSDLQPPIAADGSSVFRLGSTIPVKLGVRDCDGEPVAGLQPRVELALVDGVAAPAALDGDGRMRYDATSTPPQYIYNLSARGDLSPGTYELTVSDPAFAPVVTRITLRGK